MATHYHTALGRLAAQLLEDGHDAGTVTELLRDSQIADADIHAVASEASLCLSRSHVMDALRISPCSGAGLSLEVIEHAIRCVVLHTLNGSIKQFAEMNIIENAPANVRAGLLSNGCSAGACCWYEIDADVDALGIGASMRSRFSRLSQIARLYRAWAIEHDEWEGEDPRLIAMASGYDD